MKHTEEVLHEPFSELEELDNNPNLHEMLEDIFYEEDYRAHDDILNSEMDMSELGIEDMMAD